MLFCDCASLCAALRRSGNMCGQSVGHPHSYICSCVGHGADATVYNLAQSDPGHWQGVPTESMTEEQLRVAGPTSTALCTRSSRCQASAEKRGMLALKVCCGQFTRRPLARSPACPLARLPARPLARLHICLSLCSSVPVCLFVNQSDGVSVGS